MAPHSSTLAWKIPWKEEPGGLQSMGSLRVGHDRATSLSLLTFMYWRRNGNPLQCSCLENPRDGGAWWAAICGVAQSQTWLKWLSSSSNLKANGLCDVMCIMSHRVVTKKWITEFLNSNMRCSLIIELWVCSQNKRMIDKSRFPKDWLGSQLNIWMVDIQLYDSVELVKTFQQSVVGEKRRKTSKCHFTKQCKRLLSWNLTAQLCICFYLDNDFWNFSVMLTLI